MFKIKVIPLRLLVMVVVKDGEDEGMEETDESLAAGRFVEKVLRHLLKGIDAKEKFVRLRICQLIALAMNSLGEIEYVHVLMTLTTAMTYSMNCARLSEKGCVIENQLSGYKPSSLLRDSNRVKTKLACVSPKR